jgi:RsiW-degrading membrane proteinase PrsW (M82 family)
VTVTAGGAGPAGAAVPSRLLDLGWPAAPPVLATEGEPTGEGPPWRLPALWTTAALMLGGLVLLAVGHRYVVAMPVVLALAAVLFALHGLLLWLGVHAVDLAARRPPWLRATALAWGGVVAVGVAGFANTWLDSAVVKVVSPELAERLEPLRAATVEESVKLLGVVMLVLLARRRLAGALDGLVYGALIGLGFQEAENVHYVVVQAAGHDGSALSAFGYFVTRGVVAGWATHVAWTAIAGAGLGWAVRHRDHSWPARIGVAAAAFGGAWTLHALWNSPLGVADGLRFGADGLLRLATLNLVGLAPLALVTWLVLRGETRRCARALAGLADPAVAVDAEIATLGSSPLRFRTYWAAVVRGGRPEARAVYRLHQAQASLARYLAERVYPDPDALYGLRAAVLARREQLGAAVRASRERTARQHIAREHMAGERPLPAPAPPHRPLTHSTDRARSVLSGNGLCGGHCGGHCGGGALGMVELTVPASAVAAGALAGVGGAAVLLAGRAVRRARLQGVAADVRYGVAALLGVVVLVLAAVFAGQLAAVLLVR